MRISNAIAAVSLLGLSALCFSTATAQFPGGRSGGGFGGGGGGFGGGGLMGDPSRIFDMLAKGRPYFLISETRSLRDGLTQYSQERGITNGQITREQFTQFSDQMKTKFASGAGAAAFRPGGAAPGSGFPGAFNPGAFGSGGASAVPTAPGGMSPQMMMMGNQRGDRGGGMNMMGQMADGEFRRRDSNSDGLLNLDEMPDSVKQELSRWDLNRDQLIDENEYRSYMFARFTGEADGRMGQANPVAIIIEEEFDRRPNVLRAGKLPKELKWLEELDQDQDGQVALWEWRKAGKEIDDFPSYDRNDDGFITPEEGLRIQSARSAGSDRDEENPRASISSFPQRGNGEGDPRNKKKNGFDFSQFKKGKKNN